MSELNKKYLDLVGLQKYDALIKALIASGDQKLADDIAALEAKIGEIDVEGSVAEIVAEINEKLASLEAKDTEIEGVVSTNTQNIAGVTERVSALEETVKNLGEIEGGESLGDIVNKVNANAVAIETLKGEGEGSVKKAAADAQAAAEATAAADATSKADAALESAKAYADGLADNYEVAGAAAQALADAKADAASLYQVKGDYEVAAGLNAAMDERVAALEAIDHDKIAADAVAAVVAGAESDFDTLKEVADWIASDKVGSAALQTTVSEHTESINTINGDIDALEAKVDEDIANLTTHMSEAATALSEVDSRLVALEAFEETHDSIEIADIEGLFTTTEE